MNKKMKELLAKINAKKAEIKNLVEQEKIEEAKAAKEELKALQDKWNLLADIEDVEHDEIEDQMENGGAQDVGGKKKPEKKDIVRAFVNRIVYGMAKRQLPAEDAEIMNAMTEGAPDENGLSDGGFTVPEDIRTDINELRRASNDLSVLVNVEAVSTLSGSRVYEVDADSTPWDDVDEGGAMGEGNTPKLKKISYKIAKKGGILKVTRELLADTAENIIAYLKKWIARKSRATRNAAIIAKLNEMTTGKEIELADFDDFKDVLNVTLDASIAASSVVLTNQSGFNYIDKLKDTKGNYIIQPDVTDKSKRLLFGVYPVHVVSNKTLANKNVLKGGNGADKDDIVGYKYPVYIGDLKEAITLFDREMMTIELSTEAGDLWAKDQTGIKVRDRFDVKEVDEQAVVHGYITEAIGG